MSAAVAKCGVRLAKDSKDHTCQSHGPRKWPPHTQPTLVIRIRRAVPKTAGPANLVACRLLPDVLNTLVHLPPLATCSSYAWSVAAQAQTMQRKKDT